MNDEKKSRDEYLRDIFSETEYREEDRFADPKYDEVKRKYGNIIKGDGPVISQSRSRMSQRDRAAQFAPFAALTGYEDAIDETGRLTKAKIELSQDEREGLDLRLRLLIEEEASAEADFVYFLPDEKKSGGSYQRTRGRVKKIDENLGIIILDGGEELIIDDIIDIILVK